MLRIHSDAPSLLFPAPCISGVCLFQSENESVKLVSLSEHVIITSPEWRWWRRQMGCKVFHSGCQRAKCEIQNVFHLLWHSLFYVYWTVGCLISCFLHFMHGLTCISYVWSCSYNMGTEPHRLYMWIDKFHVQSVNLGRVTKMYFTVEPCHV